MKLYYFRSDTGNFGDDLNPWLWGKLAPDLFDGDEQTIFVGIGTLLNHRIPSGPRKVVFGSGAGYGDKPILNDRWYFSCVRGPLTAEHLGLDTSIAVTDAAALVSTVPLPSVKRDGGVAFMPHVTSAIVADWQEICNILGIRYIDPRWDVDKVLLEVLRTEVLVAEAMHGAIVADTLRVPWVPVSCYRYILDFKWMDWCASLDMEYSPRRLPGVWDIERNSSLSERSKNSLKRGLVRLGASGRNWSPPPMAKSPQKDFEVLTEAFAKLLKTMSPRLSDDHKFNEVVQRLQEKLDLIKSDWQRK